MENYGPLTFDTGGILILILFVQHLSHIILQCYLMVNGQEKDWLGKKIFYTMTIVKGLVLALAVILYFALFPKKLIELEENGNVKTAYNVQQVVFIHLDIIHIALEMFLGIHWIINQSLKEKNEAARIGVPSPQSQVELSQNQNNVEMAEVQEKSSAKEGGNEENGFN
jgi:hypothetical protein